MAILNMIIYYIVQSFRCHLTSFCFDEQFNKFKTGKDVAIENLSKEHIFCIVRDIIIRERLQSLSTECLLTSTGKQASTRSMSKFLN